MLTLKYLNDLKKSEYEKIYIQKDTQSLKNIIFVSIFSHVTNVI